jgi:hypothetical protein
MRARLKHPAQVGAMRLSAHWIFQGHPLGCGLGETAESFFFNAGTLPKSVGR